MSQQFPMLDPFLQLTSTHDTLPFHAHLPQPDSQPQRHGFDRFEDDSAEYIRFLVFHCRVWSGERGRLNNYYGGGWYKFVVSSFDEQPT